MATITVPSSTFCITLCDPFNTGADVTGNVNGDFVMRQEWKALPKISG